MRMVDLINKKRLGEELSAEEIRFIIKGFTDGSIQDYQMAAWMMAVVFQGMTYGEIAELTSAMVATGDTVDLSPLGGIKVDKHSTGGVGDTTTLVVAPLVAACGGTVAKMSGRGLGHTGGTLDKLESIDGVCIEKSVDEMIEIVKKTGLAVIGQSKNLVPADKMMYALRDVTATVKSIPLIASSIMSKKIAAGANAIVLDVKTGNGAFMETVEEAEELSSTMGGIGKHLGRRTVAIITDMNQPLGRAVGNGLEVKEAVEVLRGEIAKDDPLYQVCMLLGGKMLQLSGIAKDDAEAVAMLARAIENGSGLERLKAMVTELGGNASMLDNPESLCKTELTLDLAAPEGGYIYALDAMKIGIASSMLGAGRTKKGDKIDYAVGLVLNKRRGDRVEKGEPLFKLYINDKTNLDAVKKMLLDAVKIGSEQPAPMPMVYKVIE